MHQQGTPHLDPQGGVQVAVALEGRQRGHDVQPVDDAVLPAHRALERLWDRREHVSGSSHSSDTMM